MKVTNARAILNILKRKENAQKRKVYEGFFKSGKGEYGEGDMFLGISVPESRKIAKQFSGLPLPEIETLLKNNWHEARLVALFILIDTFNQADEKNKKQIFKFYLNKLDFVNNWDLVDVSAYKIVGEFLLKKEKALLYKLARSKKLWERRVSIITTYTFIKNGDFKDILKITILLKDDKEDLIHKALGWMLREVGKKSKDTLVSFLEKNCTNLPRTTLRYAIEKMNPQERQYFLSK